MSDAFNSDSVLPSSPVLPRSSFHPKLGSSEPPPVFSLKAQGGAWDPSSWDPRSDLEGPEEEEQQSDSDSDDEEGEGCQEDERKRDDEAEEGSNIGYVSGTESEERKVAEGPEEESEDEVDTEEKAQGAVSMDPLASLALIAASDPPLPSSPPPFKTPINYKANSSRPQTLRQQFQQPGEEQLLEAAIAASSPVKALLQLSTPRYSDYRPSPTSAHPPHSVARSYSLSSSIDLPSPSAILPSPLPHSTRPTSTLTAVQPQTPHPTRDDNRATYVSLIGSAILSHPLRRAPLAHILDWMSAAQPERFGGERTGNWWGNSVRHNLSIQDCFVKVGPTGLPLDDPLTSPGGLMSPPVRSKGNSWTIRSDFLDSFKPPQDGSRVWWFERGRRHGTARTSRRRGRKGKENEGGVDGELLSPGDGLMSPGEGLTSPGGDLISPMPQSTGQQPPQQQRLVIRFPSASHAPHGQSVKFPTATAATDGVRIGNPFGGPDGRALLKGTPKRKAAEPIGGMEKKVAAEGGKVEMPRLSRPEVLRDSGSPNKRAGF